MRSRSGWLGVTYACMSAAGFVAIAVFAIVVVQDARHMVEWNRDNGFPDSSGDVTTAIVSSTLMLLSCVTTFVLTWVLVRRSFLDREVAAPASMQVLAAITGAEAALVTGFSLYLIVGGFFVPSDDELGSGFWLLAGLVVGAVGLVPLLTVWRLSRGGAGAITSALLIQVVLILAAGLFVVSASSNVVPGVAALLAPTVAFGTAVAPGTWRWRRECRAMRASTPGRLDAGSFDQLPR